MSDRSDVAQDLEGEQVVQCAESGHEEKEVPVARNVDGNSRAGDDTADEEGKNQGKAPDTYFCIRLRSLDWTHPLRVDISKRKSNPHEDESNSPDNLSHGRPLLVVLSLLGGGVHRRRRRMARKVDAKASESHECEPGSARALAKQCEGYDDGDGRFHQLENLREARAANNDSPIRRCRACDVEGGCEQKGVVFVVRNLFIWRRASRRRRQSLVELSSDQSANELGRGGVDDRADCILVSRQNFLEENDASRRRQIPQWHCERQGGELAFPAFEHVETTFCCCCFGR